MLSTKFIQYFKLNPQIIYHNQTNAVACSLNMIEFGMEHLNSTFIFSNIDKIKNFTPDKVDESHDFLLKLANHNLIDKIKIAICFENIFKAILISHLNVVHKIDPNIHRELARKQNNTPIEHEEMLQAANGWTIDNRINNIDGINKVIHGLTGQTINYSTLLQKENYSSLFNLGEELRLDLINMNLERNNLHLHNSLSCSLSSESYNNLMRIKSYMDNTILPLQKKYCDFLGIKTKLYGVLIEKTL